MALVVTTLLDLVKNLRAFAGILVVSHKARLMNTYHLLLPLSVRKEMTK